MGVPLPWFTALFFVVSALLTVAGVVLLLFAARAVLGLGGSRRVLELVAGEVVLLLLIAFSYTFFAVAPVREVSSVDAEGRTVTEYEYEENPYLPILALPLAAAIIAAFFIFPLLATWFYRSSQRVLLLVEKR